MSKSASTLVIFWNKPFSKKLLLIRIFLLLSIAGAANLILPFKVYSGILGEINSESGRNPQNLDWEYVDQITKSIRNVSLASPIGFTCLVQATIGKILLAKNEIDSTLYFGVKKVYNQNLKAHAWLRVGSEIVLGGEVADEYTVVSTYS